MHKKSRAEAEFGNRLVPDLYSAPTADAASSLNPDSMANHLESRLGQSELDTFDFREMRVFVGRFVGLLVGWLVADIARV